MVGAGTPEDYYIPAMFCYFFLTSIIFVNLTYISTTLRKKLYPADKKKRGAVTPSKGSQGTTKATSNGLGLSSASTTKNSSNTKSGTNTNKSSSGNGSSNQMSSGISSASSSLQSGVINQSEISSSVIDRESSVGRRSSFDYR